MFLGNAWYKLTAHENIKSDDPVKGLDVAIVSDYILGPIFNITDLKNDPRIDFVGGIRGLCELERRCKNDMRELMLECLCHLRVHGLNQNLEVVYSFIDFNQSNLVMGYCFVC